MQNEIAELLEKYSWKFAIDQPVQIKTDIRYSATAFFVKGRELRQFLDSFSETYTVRREDGEIFTFQAEEIEQLNNR